MRIINFYNRFKNQWRIHKHWASPFMIAKMSWMQSKRIDNPKDMMGVEERITIEFPDISEMIDTKL